MQKNAKVAILRTDIIDYSDQPPFHPSTLFPELELGGINETGPENLVYQAVRQTFKLLNLDAPNLGTPHWNPLRLYIQPGDKVVIKPNFVLHEFGDWLGTHCLTTHGSIIRAVVDYAYLALGAEGSITIADAPLQGADFELIAEQSGLYAIQEYYQHKLGFNLQLVDLRQVRAVIDERSSFVKEVTRLKGDPSGYSIINLKEQSRLSRLDNSNPQYVVGDYDSAVTNTRHGPNRHQYVVSNTVLDANTIISLPKLKTHSKVGVTVCLKNMVGIIGSKDCLPHHRSGRPRQGGDEFSDEYPWWWSTSQRFYHYWQGRIPLPIWQLLRKMAQHLLGAGTPTRIAPKSGNSSFYSSGSWHGNDTIWRTVDDLNRILFFYDRKRQNFAAQPQRRFFACVDGIVASEGNGPLRGTPKPCGLLLAGEDPLAIDLVAATLMGFDWRQIRMLKGIAQTSQPLKYSAVTPDGAGTEIVSNETKWQSIKDIQEAHLGFRTPAGWRQHLEVDRRVA